MKRIYIVILLLCFTFFNWAQGNKFTRNWNYHLSNIRTFDVVQGNKRVYFLSKGSIYYYNQLDNSVNTITKIEGLSGSDFEGMDYSFDTKSLIVYYSNSIIDIVPDEGKIIAITDIYRKRISGDKRIYSATCYNGLCYLACGFGIVVLDIANKEIKDSFNIGDSGKFQQVYDITINNEYIYAATSQGIKHASVDAVNLKDFSNWSYIENEALGNKNFNVLTYGMGRIWAVHYGYEGEWHGDKIYSKHGSDTWYGEHEDIGIVNSISINNNDIVLTGMNNIEPPENLIYANRNGGEINTITEYPFMEEGLTIDPRSAIIDSEGVLWIADYNYGGIRVKDGVFEKLTPIGPIDNGAFSLSYSNSKLWVASGGRDSKWDGIDQPAIIQCLSGGNWDYINKYTNPELQEIYDVVQVLPFPGDPNHIYAATWGSGILEFKDGKLLNIFNESNSKLKPAYDNIIRIGGMAFDSDGNLWVTNSEVEDVLHMRKPDGTWKSFNLPEIGNATGFKIGKLIITSNNQVWIIIPRDKTLGLYVMDINDERKLHLNVERRFTNGSEIDDQKMNNVYDIVEDREGDIWVGTSLGIARYINPEMVFDKEEYFANQPAVDLNDGIYHPLLQQETVTAIVVDGGNRKWCGTRNSGIYLISKDGTEEIEHFDTESSDLISDKIISLAYDEDNGNLYIGTDLGLVSFHTDGKKPFDHFENVYAYPNPVDRVNYNGDIYITGMMENSNVKITNISGELVYETTSIGGQAVWNGLDLAGNVVHTGVYLVFCASEMGEESAVTKIAFIR